MRYSADEAKRLKESNVEFTSAKIAGLVRDLHRLDAVLGELPPGQRVGVLFQIDSTLRELHGFMQGIDAMRTQPAPDSAAFEDQASANRRM